MADVTLNTAELTLKMVKLTSRVLAQIPRLEYRDLRKLDLFEGDSFKDGVVVGWLHGSLLGDKWDRFLLVKTGEGAYGVVHAGVDATKKYPQIYVS